MQPPQHDDKLRITNPALSFNAPAGNQRGEGSMIREKLYLPQDGVNYIGLLIGPKGLFQKKLEGESGCKILIRGKGSQKEGQPPQPDDDDDQHVLIMGDTKEAVQRAIDSCNRIINADEETRNMIRKEQLTIAAEINKAIYSTDNNESNNPSQVDESMLTPYGPPSPYAYILPVPNESIGLIIGKKGETIRRLQQDSGAKIQVAKKEVEETKQRYVFIEGPEDKYQHAKMLIEEIVDAWNRNHQPVNIPLETKPSEGPSQTVPIPENLIGLILGHNNRNEQDIISCIHDRYNVKVYIPGQTNSSGNRDVEISGDPDKTVRALDDLFNYIREKSPETNLMMNPLYYTNALGWSKSNDFAYQGEIAGQGGPPQGYPPMGHPGYPPYGQQAYPPGHHGQQPPHGYPPYGGAPQGHPHAAHNPDPNAHANANVAPKEEVKGEGAGHQPTSQPPAQAPAPAPAPVQPPAQATSNPEHEKAHKYADHYSRTQGGPYQYYYDYYMKTYAGGAQPPQQ